MLQNLKNQQNQKVAKIKFKNIVIDVVKSIPKGKTMSYQEVSTHAGSPKAFRVVGSIMKRNKDLSVPCHRVIKKDGAIGQYNGLRGDKETLLIKEKGSTLS